MSSTAGRAASVLRDGVVYSGSAIVNGVNAITPHFAGAVDILVVRQPDGSLKSTPFYVRFGKYSSFRAKDRTVRIFVNGSLTNLEMHLGSYGQAYFSEIHEAFTASEDNYDGMSSPSGYSSNEDDAPYANAEMVKTVRMEVCKMQDEANRCPEDLSQDQELESSPFQLPIANVAGTASAPLRWIPVSRRDMATTRCHSEGEEIQDEGEGAFCTAGMHKMDSKSALIRRSTLMHVNSCPSFDTAVEGYDQEHGSEQMTITENQSRKSNDDAEHEDVDFFSTAASPESSSQQHNNAGERGFLDVGRGSIYYDVNDGYLGDTEPGKGTESLYDDAFPPRADGRFRGFELSLCGHLLKPDMSASDVQAIFEANKVSKEDFELKGGDITRDPSLVCRMRGELYPWSAAAPMILGMLAFGGSWYHLMHQDHGLPSPGDPKQTETESKATSGWSLWPFSSYPAKPNASVPEDHSTQKRSHSRTKVRTAPKKVLSPTPAQLASLNLKNGQNAVAYRLGDNVQQEAYIYVIEWSSKLVISDIDGTVTRSDLLGHLLPPIGVDWTHSGVAHLFSNITANGYEIMFLSSRAIAQANITRDFLHRLEQEGVKMPVGPVIISPHGLLPSLYREMILRRPHDFKIGCLQDVRKLFPEQWNPFYAGFGNRETDVISYEESGVPPSRIFTINPRGVIIRGASSCVQTSTWKSLQSINELVNEVFPYYAERPSNEIHREEYNEFQHWRMCESQMFADDPELSDLVSPFRSLSVSQQNSTFL